jgi:iron complex outermembrane recepter protein
MRISRSNSIWQSAEDFSITGDPGTIQPAYNLTNVSLQITPQRFSTVSISVFCNNALDKHYAVNLNHVKGNWTFPPGGTAGSHLPATEDRR